MLVTWVGANGSVLHSTGKTKTHRPSAAGERWETTWEKAQRPHKDRRSLWNSPGTRQDTLSHSVDLDHIQGQVRTCHPTSTFLTGFKSPVCVSVSSVPLRAGTIPKPQHCSSPVTWACLPVPPCSPMKHASGQWHTLAKEPFNSFGD